MGRRLNINTGTHGMPDGSTIFYQTPKFKSETRDNKKLWKNFLADCNVFMKQDILKVNSLKGY
jgi:hypothetical protein